MLARGPPITMTSQSAQPSSPRSSPDPFDSSRSSPTFSSAPEALTAGVLPLIALLRSPRPHVVLAALRTLRALFARVGHVPQRANQRALGGTQGVRLMGALAMHAADELVRGEASASLACAALGQLLSWLSCM